MRRATIAPCGRTPSSVLAWTSMTSNPPSSMRAHQNWDDTSSPPVPVCSPGRRRIGVAGAAVVPAHRVLAHREAEQVRELPCHGRVGDRPPSSTVRQMVSANRLAAAFKAGPRVFDARRESLHLHTPHDPDILCLTASAANPRYALRIRKGRESPGLENLTCSYDAHYDPPARIRAAASATVGTTRSAGPTSSTPSLP